MVSRTDRNNNNETALKLAEKKLGRLYNVTMFFERLVSNLTECGFVGADSLLIFFVVVRK